MSQENRGLPVDQDTDAADVFWEGCSRREFWLQYCNSCAQWQYYPRSICSHCWQNSGLEWRRPSGTAALESFSVVHRGSGGFADLAPYVVALVRLEEGPVMMTNIIEAADDLSIGDRLTVDFAEHNGRVVPVFRRIEAST